MFKEIKNRDAWSTLRGFVYQVDTTILRWLDLKNNEVLELEKGEDIDVVTRDLENNEVSRELEQIKYRESNISLNQETSIEILFNFFLHKKNNPDKKVYFRFVTNTNYAIERPALFHNGKSGIEIWTELRKNNPINKKDERFKTIKRHLLNKLKHKLIEDQKIITKEEIDSQKNWKHFIAYIEDDNNFIQFIFDFEWSFGNEDYSTIENSITKKLIDLEIVEDANKAKLLYPRLFLFIFKFLCNMTFKVVNKEDLQKQISFPELTKADQNILGLINNLLWNIDKRVNELEVKVNLNSNQIATLINDVKIISNSDTVFNFQLRNISINPPSLIKNGSLRKEKLSEIIKLFEDFSWVNFQGINGTGKTQLASLICIQFQTHYWLDLRNYNRSVEKTTLLVEAFLSVISNCPIVNNRKTWLKEVLKCLDNGILIIFNDLPRIEKDSVLSQLFVDLTNSKKVKILTTSNYRISLNVIQGLNDDLFYEYYGLDFTDIEIIEILVNNGANESVAKYINLITAISHRNPRLVSAIVQRLKYLNWGQDSDDLFDIIFKREFSTELLEDSQLLIKKIYYG